MTNIGLNPAHHPLTPLLQVPGLSTSSSLMLDVLFEIVARKLIKLNKKSYVFTFLYNKKAMQMCLSTDEVDEFKDTE